MLGYNLTGLDFWHRHVTSDILFKTSENPWIWGPRRVHLFMRLDGGDIKKAGAIKLWNIYNTFSALPRRDLVLVDIIKLLVSYAGAFDLKYRVKLFNALIKDI